METIERDYAPRGVKFYYIYKALAHPETNGYITPFNLQERLMHVAEAKRTLGSRIQWICDSMDNDLKHALGDRPNSEFIVDPKGEIVVSRSWSNPSDLRQDLAKLVGEVDDPTSVGDLNMKQLPPPQKAATGVVKRIELPGQMSPLKIVPVESRSPHYAKLRVESGSGKMYLGFFLDPLYKVHWNNKAAALKFSIESPSGVSVTPDSGSAPKVGVDADADPREFLIEVSGRSSDPLKVVVKYFACDDAETFCVPVTQEYLVSFDRDPDGGNRRSPGNRGGGNRGGGNRGVARGQGGPPASDRMRDMMQRMPVLAALDSNGDGTLSASELSAAPRALRKVDRNDDGDISGEELRPSSGVSRRFNSNSQKPGQDRGNMFAQYDRDQDGKLSGPEIPDQMRRMLARIDTDEDGVISKSEFQNMVSRRGGQRGNAKGPPQRRGSQ